MAVVLLKTGTPVVLFREEDAACYDMREYYQRVHRYKSAGTTSRPMSAQFDSFFFLICLVVPMIAT